MDEANDILVLRNVGIKYISVSEINADGSFDYFNREIQVTENPHKPPYAVIKEGNKYYVTKNGFTLGEFNSQARAEANVKIIEAKYNKQGKYTFDDLEAVGNDSFFLGADKDYNRIMAISNDGSIFIREI